MESLLHVSLLTRNNNPQRVYILFLVYCDGVCVRFLFSGSFLVHVTDYVVYVGHTRAVRLDLKKSMSVFCKRRSKNQKMTNCYL